MAKPTDKYTQLKAGLEEFLSEMDRDEKLVQLGIFTAHHDLGLVSLDEYNDLWKRLGFTADDLDNFGI